ncbi:MAG: hypothetical protein KY453_10160 [Gemmatimonadetes bacterium]|nr:hypothetical protein [Gemmatimonadota bacterium]
MVALGTLVLMAMIILLPIVPAYLLYRLLPSTGDVQGPWQGLQIKLGGAFAGYFLLVVTLLGFWKTLPTYEVWGVEGRLDFADGQGDPGLVGFSLRPSNSTVSPDGRFRVSVFAFPDQSGAAALPMLVVDHPGYRPAAVDLARVPERSRIRRSIRIPDVIELRAAPLATEHVSGGGP